MSVWLPISPTTKACHVEGWSAPSYLGINPEGRKWLGLRCDRLVIIDCDSQEACDWWLARIGLPLSHTYTVKTKAGWHFYYTWTPGSPTSSRIGTMHDHLDVKAGSGSLVVVPPSPGKTELFDLDMMPFRHSWIPAVERSAGEDYDEIPDGRGNNTVTAIGGALRKQGFSPSLIEAALLAMNPVIMPTSPMPERTIEQIAKSVSRYETSPDWDIELDLSEEDVGDDGEIDDRPHRVVDAAARAQRPPAVWSIEHVLPETGVGQVFGDTYTGKSLVALDMALGITNDIDEWYGHPINVHGDVLYILMEGVFDLNQRIESWLLAHKGCDDSRLYTIEEESVDLASPESLLRVVSDIETSGITPVLIIFDTQSLAAPGTDENSNTEMNLVFSNLKKMSKRFGCPIYTVHHTGYEGTHARGASAQKAAVDFQIQVKPGELKVEKVKGYKPTAWLKFELEELGSSVWAAPRIGELSWSQQILELHRRERLTKDDAIARLGGAPQLRRAYADLISDDEIEVAAGGIIEVTDWVEVDWETDPGDQA